MEDIVKEAIDKLECIGLNVVVVMSDQGSCTMESCTMEGRSF
jgi:hypothetical protein